jgi:hypothetical protein
MSASRSKNQKHSEEEAIKIALSGEIQGGN